MNFEIALFFHVSSTLMFDVCAVLYMYIRDYVYIKQENITNKRAKYQVKGHGKYKQMPKSASNKKLNKGTTKNNTLHCESNRQQTLHGGPELKNNVN